MLSRTTRLRGNTLQSDEDIMKLTELMELCTNLQTRVLDLEKTKTTQALEIYSLKRRVKRLEKKQRSRTHKLKRLYKVGLIARVDSSKDEQNLGEVVFVDKEVADKEVNDEENNEVQKVVEVVVEDSNTAKLIIDAAQVNAVGEVNAASIATTDSAAATIKTKEITMAQALVKIKTTKPKTKGIVLQEPSESPTTTTTVPSRNHRTRRKRRKFFAAKRAEEKRNKPPTLAQQRKIMCTYLKNMEGKKLKDLKNKSFNSIQKMFDRAFKRVNTFVDFKTELVMGSSKRAGEELTQENAKKQKVEDDKKQQSLNN
nr:hypothetical protein [Tanacetum cinerariifolium]